MTSGGRGRGFFLGAAGGLALALLLVGAGSLLPQQGGWSPAATNPPLNLASASAGAAATATNSSLAPQVQMIGGVSAGNETGAEPSFGAAVSATTTAAASGAEVFASLGSPASSQRPASALAALPVEGAGAVLSAVSPLLIGLLVAGLVYGAYLRRQDSA